VLIADLVFSRSESGDGLRLNTSVRAAIAALPQGPSLRSGLCCPGPSSLNWSHAPHSQAHLDFTVTAYTRCLRCAAYCDLGNPRVDPCFRWHSVSTCRPPGPREVHSAAYTQFLHRRRWPSTKGDCGLGTSKFPHPPILVGGSVFEASLRFTFVATCRFARPPVGADQVFTQPTWTFTSGLPTDWSPAPPPDITTVATGQVPPAGLSPASMPTSIAATPRAPHSGRERPGSPAREFSFAFHQIQQAIEPHLSLQQTLYSWNQIAEALGEKSRNRPLQLSKWYAS
jgi:hypothetical protein